jgi:outer membrane lipoprotein-sorting protein
MSRFTAIQTRSLGKIESQGLEFIRELSFQSPNRFKEIVHVTSGTEQFEVMRVYNGKQGWFKSMGRTSSMVGPLRDAVKDEIAMMNLPRSVFLGSEDYELAALGESTDRDRPVLGVKLSGKGRKEVILYFDKETGLLAKTEQRSRDVLSGLEVNEARIILAYQEVSGMQTTKKALINHDGKKYMEVEVLEVRFQESLDDSEFNRP